MFKVNFTTCSSVSTVNFEHAIPGWDSTKTDNLLAVADEFF